MHAATFDGGDLGLWAGRGRRGPWGWRGQMAMAGSPEPPPEYAGAGGGGHGHGHGRRGRRFGPPGGFPPGGPFPGGGRRRGRAGRGDVRGAILLLLAEQPMHGYQVMQELTERSQGAWSPSPGSVYPALNQLEDEGLVRAEEAEGKRVFHLTDAGRDLVASRPAGAPAPWEVAAAGDGGRGELRELMFGLGGAVMEVARTGSPRQVERAKQILDDARRSLYRLLAEGPEDTGPAPGA